MPRAFLFAAVLSLGFAAQALAASLQIAPVGFDLPASTKAAQLTLHNLGTSPLNAQIRIFRWSQANGQDQLAETQDVVASPPAATIEPDQDHLIRLVRTAAAPVAGEESYRLLVDELAPPPDPNTTTTGITFVVRYSVPVFFHDAKAAAHLAWTASIANNSVSISVQNSGTRHMRISEMTVTSASGSKIVFSVGLVGYVLAGSAMSWSKPVPANSGFVSGSTVSIAARGDNNAALSATAVLSGAK